MAEISWAAVFGRLNKGESAAELAKELGVDRSTVWRKYQVHLESQVAGKRHELAQVQSTIENLGRRKTELEIKIGSLGDEYAKRKFEEERKLIEALRALKDELEATKAKIAELKRLAGERGFSIEQALGLLSKIKDLRSELPALENRVLTLKAEKKALEAEISTLSGRHRILQGMVDQLQLQYQFLSNWSFNERPQLENYKSWLESAVAKLEAKKRDGIKITEKLDREIGAKEKVNEGLNAALEKTRGDLNETVEKLSGATTDLVKIRGKSDEEVEVSRIRVQAILTSASLQAEEILKSSKVQGEEILTGTVAKKGELEREVSELEGEIAELQKKREDLEAEYEKRMKTVEHRLNEIREAWAQMVRATETRGIVLPSLGF